jgi:predicted dithiol-disulfide oxidoreductase (DUF899 family)
VSLPEIASRETWLAARLELLAREKELTRTRDALNEQRRALPMVEMAKEYVFEGPDGKVRLIDLFEGRSQLLVYHFMWLFDTDEGCPTCSFLTDHIGYLGHLHESGTTLALVSRAPYASIERFQQRMGWTIPWYSSYDTDFNVDFHVTSDESRGPVEYNYKDKETLEREGIGYWAIPGQDGPGMSVFVRDGDRVFHTYSTYARGLELILNTFNFLDLTPSGRQKHIAQFPHHDKYGEPAAAHHHHH